MLRRTGSARVQRSIQGRRDEPGPGRPARSAATPIAALHGARRFAGSTPTGRELRRIVFFLP
jgi:hypothetical protein